MIHDAPQAWRRLFFSWGVIFLLGFLLVRVEALKVFMHWIPLAIFGFAMTLGVIKYTGKSAWLISLYWLSITAVVITLTGLIFTGTIPYPSYVPLWGMAVLGFLGLAHAAFGLWIRNRSFVLIGGLWMITAAALWNAIMIPDNEVIILAFATSIPYFIAGVSYKTKAMKVRG